MSEKRGVCSRLGHGLRRYTSSKQLLDQDIDRKQVVAIGHLSGLTLQNTHPATSHWCPLGKPKEDIQLKSSCFLAWAIRRSGLTQGSLHYASQHCLVNGGFPLFWWKKQHVSNGCKMYLLRIPVTLPTNKTLRYRNRSTAPKSRRTSAARSQRSRGSRRTGHGNKKKRHEETKWKPKQLSNSHFPSGLAKQV